MEKKEQTSGAENTPDTQVTAEALAVQKATIEQKESELQTFEKKLNEREKSLSEREQKLNKKEQTLNEREANLPVVEAQEVKVVPGVKFKFRGDNYQFTNDAPKKIRFGGIVYTQKELVKDEDILIQLVGGNSSLIQKL